MKILIIFDWAMPEIPESIFSQKIRTEYKFNNIELLVCSLELDSEDSFLMTEMDIHYVMLKSTNASEYIAKIEEVFQVLIALKIIFRETNIF